METESSSNNLIHSYLTLRRAVGWIGILLPFVLMAGVFIFFGGDRILGSISQYYYSGMRDVFVGALCGISLFLFFYKGYDNWGKINWDKWLTNLAAILALVTAFFPTTEEGPNTLVGNIHLISASLFFIILACFSIFIFTMKGGKITRQKQKRNRIYVACGVVMIISLIAIFIYFRVTGEKSTASSFIFWGETVALIAFGISWLTKGGTLFPDKNKDTAN